MLHLKKFTFNPFSENTYVLYNDSGSAFLIDPGNFNEEETRTLQNFIVEKNLKIKNILLTHAHIDHVLGLQWAYDTYAVPVLLHEIEKEILERNPFTAKQYGFFFKPFEGEINYIKEGEILHLDEDELKIYFVPGHSPGHVAFHNEEQKFIISGDVLFEGSIGRTDLYKGDFEELLTSIRENIFTLDEATKVHSGHGNPTTVQFEKAHNPFLK